MDNIIIIDNCYKDIETYNGLFDALTKYPFKYGWSDQTGSPYWNISLDEKDHVHNLADKLWQEFSSKFEYLGNLSNCYINGLTFGLEAGPHYDYEADDGVTVVNYVTDMWNLTWGGETVIYDQFAHDTHTLYHVDEILCKPINVAATVVPAYNRSVIFPSNQLHMVKPLSRHYGGMRMTMMYKLQGVTVEQAMNGYKT